MSKPRFPGLGQLCALVFVLLVCAACRPSAAPAPSTSALPPTSIPTQTATPTVTNRATLTPLPSLTPTLTATHRPTFPPSLTPMPTTALGALSPGGPWLAVAQITNTNGGFYRQVDVVLLNQDGSGGQLLQAAGCDEMVEDSTNYLVKLNWDSFLVNPGVGMSYDCGIHTGKSGKDGFGTTFMLDTDTGLPRLNVYRLPAGKLLHSFPLVRCAEITETCSADVWGWGEKGWSGDGRYLPFSVLLEDGTWGLYVYDTEQNAALPLAKFTESIYDVWWVPDSSRMIVGISGYSNEFVTDRPNAAEIGSLWVVPVRGGEMPYRLYTRERPWLMEVVDWLDENRFLLVDGSLSRVVEEGVNNLRAVDMRTGEVEELFMDGFVSMALDRKDETIFLYVNSYNSHYDYGHYLVSTTDPEPRAIGLPPERDVSSMVWRDDLGLFVAEFPECEEYPGQFPAVDLQGKWQCVQLPETANSGPKDIWVSPDQQWQASARDGLWLEGQSQSLAQVYPDRVSQVIWQSDSGGFFFISGPRWTDANLYHVSLPDLTLRSLGFHAGGGWDGSDPAPFEWIEK